MVTEEQNLIRFINITRKKEGLYANFKVKGARGGANFSAALTVPLSEAEVDPGDALETIIEACARLAVREFQHTEFQFEGLASI